MQARVVAHAVASRVSAVLAYVFWHWPAAGDGGYEERLAGFHESLSATPPAGFRGSSAFRVRGLPWVEADAGYEDWYLVEDWAALGALDAGAVDAARRRSHDEVAVAAAKGTGGLYGLRDGDGALGEVAHASWLAKERGVPYEEWDARVRRLGASTWRRQLTLGPAPEYVLLGERPPDVEADIAVAYEATIW